MARRTNRQRISKPKMDPTVALALSIVPTAQVANGRFERCGVSNHSDQDQRHMVRSGERFTIRRKPKIDELVQRGTINEREGMACEWYAQAHALRYDTTGVTMRYGTAGGGGRTNFDHLPKSREQQDAYDHFAYAREGISSFFLPTFERVVLYGWPLGKAGMVFRSAARELLARIEDKVAL
jgi:hypothetical protein